jgi:PAS domain S-box-containing protein
MDEPRQRRVGRHFPFVLLLAGGVLTLFGTFYVREALRMQRHLEFENEVQHARLAIDNRIESQATLLRGVAAFFAVHTNISRDAFQSYIQRLRLQTNYPGVQGIGFAARTSAADLEKLVTDLRHQGETNFTVWPEGVRREYFPIVYLEPRDSMNRAAIGFDMFNEPVRREAMERARDKGHYAACGKVTLVQEIYEQKQSGFLICVPVYEGGGVPSSVEERRKLLKGFVYSAFRVKDFLASVWAAASLYGMAVHIYDGTEIRPENMIYQTGPDPRIRGTWLSPRERREFTSDIAGRPWTICLAETRELNRARWIPLFILLGGLGLSITFFLLSLAESRARRDMEEYARQLRRSEEALRRSETQLRLIIESAQDYAIFSMDLKGMVNSWNSGAERMFGFRESEVIGRSGAIIFTPEDRERHAPEDELDRAVSLGLARDDRWHQRKDGKRIFVSGVVRPMTDPSGHRVGFTKIARDVTERLLAQEKFRREKEFSDTIINSLPATFYLFDSNGKWLRWNENTELVTGYSPEELVARAPSDFFNSPEKELVQEAIRTILAQGQAIVEASIVTKKGDSIPYLMFGRRIVLDGKPCVMGMGVDISERKRVELELRDAEERLRNYTVELEHRVTDRTAHLRQSLASLEGLLYHVAHDLRAPLRAMASFTTILSEEYSDKLDQRGCDYTRRIANSARFMDELLQDLLAYGRLTHTPVMLHDVNLEALVDSVLEQLRPEIESSRAVVEVQRPLPIVKANTAVLSQVLFNLIANALKFCPPKKSPCVHIGARTDKVVRFWVQDEGIGIRPEYHERVFRVFERLHGEKEYSGTGIGLAIVQKGVERLGGRVGVESEPGKGSRFWVELPGVDVAEGEQQKL